MLYTAYASWVKHLRSPSLIYLSSRLIPAALQMVGVGLFVRLLGEEEYGRYTLTVTVVLLAGNVGVTWLVQSVLRYRSAYRDKGAAEWDQALRAASGISLLLTAVATGGLLLLRGVDLIGSIGGILAAIGLFSFSLVYAERQANLDPSSIFVAEIIRGVTGLGLPLFLLAAGWKHYSALLYGLAASNLLGALLLHKGLPTRPRWEAGDRTLIAKFWKFGFPLTIWMGISLLLNASDRFVIGWALGLGPVGVYSAVYDVVFKSTTLVLAPILLAAHPVLMSTWNQGQREEAQQLLRRTELQTFMLGVVLSLGWWGAAPWAARLLTGTSDANTVHLILPISLGAVIWATAMVSQKPLEMRERTTLMCGLAVLALIVQVALNATLLPRYGLEVAAWACLGAASWYYILVRITLILLLPKSNRSSAHA